MMGNSQDLKPHVLFVQHGDYLSAMKRMSQGEPETYRGQNYTLEVVDELVKEGSCTVVGVDLCGVAPYDVEIENYHLILDQFVSKKSGLKYHAESIKMGKKIVSLIENMAPTHIIMRTPGWLSYFVGKWAIKNGIPFLPCYAGYFPLKNLKDKLLYKILCSVFNNPSVLVVANHNYPASHSMAIAGVRKEKIISWDFPNENHPSKVPPKKEANQLFSFVYAGLVDKKKGVEDIIRALYILSEKGCQIRGDVFGEGKDAKELQELVETLHLGKRITFHGLVPNTVIKENMRTADCVIVPSHHSYTEGLPLVIYECLEMRTPLLCSDHPCFKMVLKEGVGVHFFPSENPKELATAISDLITTPALYSSLSENSIEAWENLVGHLSWGDLLQNWFLCNLPR